MPECDDFDRYASEYTEVLDVALSTTGADRDYFAVDRVERIRRREQHDGRTPSRILDLGCGDGATEVHLERAFPAARVSAVDISAESIRIGAERGLDRCEFVHYDGDRLPYPDAWFQLVYIAGVLHHVPDDSQRASVLAEVARVLQPGCRAYVFEHNPLNPFTRRIVDRCPFDDHARLIRARELRGLTEAAGLVGVETHYIHFAPRHRLFSPVHAVESHLRGIPIGAQYFVVAGAPRP